ncbi:MAG TPA: S8 family serine peptidase [Pirellulales bacterium]
MRPGPLVQWGFALGVIAALSSLTRADTTQNAAAAGSSAALTAAGFNLNGLGVRVGIVEAGASFANASYSVGQNTPGAIGGTSTMAFPSGNPDLSGPQIDFLQLPGQVLPVNPIPFPAGNNFQIGNHATAVTGVVMGSGVNAAADLGIAPQSRVEYAAIPSNATNSQVNASNSVQQVLSAGAPLVNMSWGYAYSIGAGNTYLSAAGYTQATSGGNLLYLAVGGGTTTNVALAATYAGTGGPIPIVTLQAATGVPTATNNGSALVSQFTDWEATTYNKLMVIAGNEAANSQGNPTSLTPTTGYFGVNGGVRPNLGLEAGAPSDDYNSINVGATGQRGIFNAGVFQPNPNGGALYYGAASGYNTTNITSDVSPITGYGRLKTDMVAPGGDPGDAGGLNGIARPNLAGGLTFNDKFQSTAGGVTTNGGTGDPSSDSYNGAQAGFNDPTTGSSYFTNGANVQPYSTFGTSFAAPLVTGASGLVYQYGNNSLGGGVAVDHRVIKAIMLNGASHTFEGANLLEADGATPWTRAAGKGTTPLLAGTTVVQFGGSNPTVRPGLDFQLGTGTLNLVGSLKNYAAGRQQPGLVNPIGWDSQTVALGAAANTIVDTYTINVAIAGLFNATLAWDDPVAINNPGAGNTFANNSTFTRGQLTDLDLYLFALNPDGSRGQNIDFSTSDIDNVEYLYDTLAPGKYEIDVADAQFAAPQATTYGLAWTSIPVPEPMAFAMAAIGGLALLIVCLRQSRAIEFAAG